MRAQGFVLSFSILYLAVVSCARFPFTSPPDPLYREISESFTDYDAAVLVGRTIILDPGHGGRFDGAIGRYKTRESDVNLGVALELQRMLLNCGANVILTRTSDMDLLSPEESPAVARDLSRRVEVSNAVEADLFISIHHNSTASGDRDHNAIETYYRMDDDGPSLDAARYVHKHMVENLGEPDNALIPGNYHVLRNNDNPSLLEEASYISNPRVEKKIREQEKQLLEARAYLFGIIDYFSRGIPKAVVLYPADAETVMNAAPQISILLEAGERGGGIDRSSPDIRLDGRPVDWCFEEPGDLLSARPAHALTSGPHVLEVQFRNLMGNCSRRTKAEFITVTEPAALLIRTLPARIAAGVKTPFLLEVTVVDKNGNRAADGEEVHISLPSSLVGEHTAITKDGTAHFYLTAVQSGDHTCRISSSTISSSIILKTYQDIALPLAVRFTDGALGLPLAGVKVKIDQEQVLITNRDGYIFSESLPKGEHNIVAEKNGYRTYMGVINTDDRGRDSGLRMLLMEPVHAGVLIGKSIVINPEGGGMENRAVGPFGTRSSDLNLRVALKLADYLSKAGADVSLTRTGDKNVPTGERISLANRNDADYFISIRHDATGSSNPPPYIAFYGTSESGKALATSITSEWAIVTGENTVIRGEYSHILRQTPCPAVAVMCRDIGTVEGEESTYSGDYGTREAYSIYTGITTFLLGDESIPLSTVKGQVQMDRNPLLPILLMMDGWLIIPTDRRGHFVARNITPGQHLFELITPEDQKGSWWVNTETLGLSPVILTP